MSRDWTPDELQAASTAMKAAGHLSYEEFCDELSRHPLKLVLRYVGRDSWDRPVYESGGRLYVDVDPRKGYGPDIRTKQDNFFDGEPRDLIPEGTEVEFVPERDVW